MFQDNRSLVISIAFTSQDPQLSAKFVNTLIDDYVASRARHRVDANEGANAVIEKRVDQARADLAAIEQQMRDLRDKGDVVGVRAGSIGQQQVEELTTAAARAAVERSPLRGELRARRSRRQTGLGRRACLRAELADRLPFARSGSPGFEPHRTAFLALRTRLSRHAQRECRIGLSPPAD